MEQIIFGGQNEQASSFHNHHHSSYRFVDDCFSGAIRGRTALGKVCGMNELTIHPAADAFPMMNGKRFSELVDDIREHGLIEAITLFEGKILDGRNRYKACLELGIDPKTKQISDVDPWAYVWSLNGERRDLVDEQRYLIWKFCSEQSEAFQAELRRIAEEANRKRSEAQKGIPKDEIKERARTECSRTSKTPARKSKAAAAKVNTGAVARGDKLYNERPDLAQQVMKGDIKPAEAHLVARY